MKCTDCKGNRVYVGLGHYNEREPCQRCKGSGEEPGEATGPAPLRDYQQQALDETLASRALWTGHAEEITRAIVLRVSKSQGCFPGRIYLRTFPDRRHFADVKYDNGQYVRFDDAETGLHWLLLGRRTGPSIASNRWITWEPKQAPRPVVQDYAQDHYLALYKRVEMKNEFKCIWHY